MAAAPSTPTEYINGHLTHFAKPVGGDGGFWMIHVDTLVMTIIVGALTFGFLWWVVRGATAGVPGRRQAIVELLVDFVNEGEMGLHGYCDGDGFPPNGGPYDVAAYCAFDNDYNEYGADPTKVLQVTAARVVVGDRDPDDAPLLREREQTGNLGLGNLGKLRHLALAEAVEVIQPRHQTQAFV